MAKVPADPAIPSFALQGWSGKADKGHPFIEPGGNIPKGLADFWQGTQIMVFLHQFLVAFFFGLANGSNKDLLEIHDNFSGLCVGYGSILSLPIHHFRRFVQIFIQLIKINYQ